MDSHWQDESAEQGRFKAQFGLELNRSEAL